MKTLSPGQEWHMGFKDFLIGWWYEGHFWLDARDIDVSYCLGHDVDTSRLSVKLIEVGGASRYTVQFR